MATGGLCFASELSSAIGLLACLPLSRLELESNQQPLRLKNLLPNI